MSKNTNINVPVDQELKTKLQSIAKKLGLDLAPYIRMRLIEIAKEHDER